MLFDKFSKEVKVFYWSFNKHKKTEEVKFKTLVFDWACQNQKVWYDRNGGLLKLSDNGRWRIFGEVAIDLERDLLISDNLWILKVQDMLTG